MESWVAECREAAKVVAGVVAELKIGRDGLTEGSLTHWTEQKATGPICVFECIWKGRSIVRHRKRVEISAQHVSLLHERFRR